MSTVYFLLRNNVQLGPFTFDELLQQSLCNKDLVWAEGTSTVWAFPSELKELHPWFPPKKSSAEPAETTDDEKLELRAAEIRGKSLSANLQSPWLKAGREPDLNESHAFIIPEEMQIEFIDHRNDRKREVPLSELLAAAMVTVIVGASLYGGRVFLGMSNKQDMAVTAPVQVVSVQQNAAKAPLLATEQVLDTMTSITTDSLLISDSVIYPEVKHEPLLSKKEKKQSDSTLQDMATAAQESKAPEVLPVEVQKPADTPAVDSIRKEEPAAQQEEKKKSLGQVLKGLFKKKKKDKQPADSTQTNE